MLSDAGELPIYYPNDEEVYFRAANVDDGSLFCAVFNLGMDPIDAITLGCETVPQKMEMLDCDGTRKAVTFTVNEEAKTVTVDIPAYTLAPVVLFLS
jgi:hypothetical protein